MPEPREYPFSAQERLDFDPLFAALREQEPVCRVRFPYGEPTWMATRYEDVKLVLTDSRFGCAAVLDHDEPRMQPVKNKGGILTMDPPEHTRLRKLVAKAFTQRRVERLSPRVQEIADGLVDRMIERGSPVDVVDEFARLFPITVVCELLGVPHEEQADLRAWSDAFMSTAGCTPEHTEDCMHRMSEYMAELIERRRAEPEDDLISVLIQARDEHDKLTEAEMVRLAVTLLVAGQETTATQIVNFLYVLLTHPAEFEWLLADLGRVPRAVEELMRYIPLGTVGGFPRYAREDVELGGVTVRAGEPVVVDTRSANRDESVFDDGERLDLSRSDNAHLAFGHGAHFCIGAQLARLMLQVGLRTLLDRLPGLRFAVDADDVAWKEGMILRGPAGLEIAWDSAGVLQGATRAGAGGGVR
ncbi:cytochrome P450 [Saccharopolyspora shandongensis]|uniref:cytochrome P450 n=1 Tax=Saccharopolyspora shandongensis TaxID=418495 RepID=UPI0033EE83F3